MFNALQRRIDCDDHSRLNVFGIYGLYWVGEISMSTILIAIIALAVLAAVFGAILGFASIRFKVEADPIVDQIDTILPQTQCGQCGYWVVAHTQRRSLTETRSTNVLRAAKQLLRS